MDRARSLSTTVDFARTVYLPKEGTVTVKLEPGAYEASWFSAFTGEKIPLPPVLGPEWTSPKSPGWLDWAILIRKRQAQ